MNRPAFLLLAPGFLAEVLSQNTALTTALQPLPFLLTVLTLFVVLFAFLVRAVRQAPLGRRALAQ